MPGPQYVFWCHTENSELVNVMSHTCRVLPQLTGLNMLVHISEPRTWEVEEGGSGVQGQPWLHNKFQNSLGLCDIASTVTSGDCRDGD